MQVLIDGDELVYKACVSSEDDVDFGDFHALVSDWCDVQNKILSDLERISEKADGGQVHVAMSDSRNFRKEFCPSYKANRKSHRKPLAFRRAVEFLEKEVLCISYPTLEADDVLGILSQQYDMIVSSDKDLLTIPGCVYSILKDTVTTVTPEQADWNWFMQALMGDRVDGYAGAKGMGAKRAARFLEGLGGTSSVRDDGLQGSLPGAYTLLEDVVGAFEGAGQTRAEANESLVLARILRPGEYDVKNNKVVNLHWC